MSATNDSAVNVSVTPVAAAPAPTAASAAPARKANKPRKINVEEGKTYKAKVVRVLGDPARSGKEDVRHALLVEANGTWCKLDISQFPHADRPARDEAFAAFYADSEAYRTGNKETYLMVKVMKVVPGEGDRPNVIHVSAYEAERETSLASVVRGAITRSKVISLQHYGAFLNLTPESSVPARGLLHRGAQCVISEARPALEVGAEVRVVVLETGEDAEGKPRISLGEACVSDVTMSADVDETDEVRANAAIDLLGSLQLDQELVTTVIEDLGEGNGLLLGLDDIRFTIADAEIDYRANRGVEKPGSKLHVKILGVDGPAGAIAVTSRFQRS